MAHIRFWRLLAALLFASVLLFAPFSTVLTMAQEAEEDVVTYEDSSSSDSDDGGSEVVSTGNSEEEAVEEFVPAPGVETVAVFPAHLEKTPTIHAGQTTELLLGLVNTGESPVTVFGITGNLYVVMDGIYNVQNFSAQTFNLTVQPGVQSSFPFTFTPDAKLQARDFGLAAKVFYEVDGQPHANVFFNKTIEVIEPVGVVSGETVFLGLLAVGVATLVGIWIYAQLDKISKKSKRAKKVETGTKSDADDVASNEWLQGTFFVQKKSKSSSQPLKSRKKRLS